MCMQVFTLHAIKFTNMYIWALSLDPIKQERKIMHLELIMKHFQILKIQ